MQMDARLFEEYIKVGKKADSIRTLLKLLMRLQVYGAIRMHMIMIRQSR